MAAPKGNNNAAKGKRWSHALEMAAEYYPEKPPIGKNEKMKGIYEAAYRFWHEMMMENKLYGSLPYFKELGDRLDGKPKQQMELSQDLNNPLFDMTQDERQREINRYIKTIGSGSSGVIDSAESASKTH